MYQEILNKIESRYHRACFAAYNYDFDNLVANFNKEDFNIRSWYDDDHYYSDNDLRKEDKEGSKGMKLTQEHTLTYYIVRGARFSFYFAWKLRHSDLELNQWIYRAISARFIMSNYLEDDIIKKYIPACVWYPNIPTKETCFKLLEILPDYKYTIGFVAGYNNWKDVFVKCDFKCVDAFLWKMLLTLKREEMLNILKDKADVRYFIKKDGRVNLDAKIWRTTPEKIAPYTKKDICFEPFAPERLMRYRSINEEYLEWNTYGQSYEGPTLRADVTGIGYIKGLYMERRIHLNERMEELYM
ncbi:hypothetical protein KAFR_0K00130 [Kazachstania africana CBS 2517]|uniref:Uncharacterized protein n=1 Tax=Kazachstania africana (strain ATCC 22294 / BCRC 22015 / CBS 2517 / CECT 1963 / NBRC 1671 / NRRL Y-8276) TaxID=1071382 RepID=H2B166_KAZAF|nr:hypothetical protein KAFR_0K00130 [Kazachstania africana CBS 2517]CCF60366.1 hypothetical protein KAFR_0K00130 [Kazachstania africana CBS 2517]